MICKKIDVFGLLILLFHLIGMLGLSSNNLSSIFLDLVPLNLLLTFLYCYKFSPLNRHYRISGFIFTFGFLVEVVGVKTGLLFGEYSYGYPLGLKFLNVPLIIGINWLILAICSYGLISYFITYFFPKVILASIFMVLIDILIEPVAINLGFWSWDLIDIPIKNYFMWFIVSFIINYALASSQIKINPRMSTYVLISQLIFFTYLNFAL